MSDKTIVSIPRRLTTCRLESYLWGAATYLRGLIDAGEYKQFIFPLLFLKRISDIFDEEFEQALEVSGGDISFASFAENHRFLIPEGAHWRDVHETSVNLGLTIQKAMRSIETANPKILFGIFGDAQWTNKDRLPDSTLRDLLDHFNSVTLSLSHIPEDEMGVCYEYLIKKFADDSGHTAAEFYTNRTVVHLMTIMLEPQERESIYDPTCGSGGMLLSCAVEVKQQGMEWRNLRLLGQERNLLTSAIARMNLFLHGFEDFGIIRGDTLSDPKFVEGDRLRQFDLVLANPPYSIKQWDRSKWASDPYGRNKYGTPPQGRADYAFWGHILASMKPDTGRCAILFPHGVLFRDEERSMREKIVTDDVIECVLGLGPNLFYNSPMEACVIFCRANKPDERRGKILFIDAKQEVTRERAQSFLTEGHIEKIAAAYWDFEDAEGFARVAEIEEIAANDFNLNLPLYVRNGMSDGGEDAPQLAEVIEDWKASSLALRVSMGELFAALDVAPPAFLQGESETDDEATISQTIPSVAPLGEDRSEWRKVKFGEVVYCPNESERDPLEKVLNRLIGLEHIDTEDLCIKRWGDVADGTSFSRVFRKGQVLFGKRRAYQRKVAVADFDGICSGDILVFEAKSDALLPKLLPFIVQSEGFFQHALGTSAGSMSPRTKWSELANYEFSLPPMEAQLQIAELLWAADDSISRLVSLAVSIHASFKASIETLILDPDKSDSIAPIKFLKDICVMQNGRAYPSTDYDENGIKLLRPGNLGSDGYFDWNKEGTRCLPLSYRESAGDYIVGPKEVVINLTAQSLEDGFMGRVCFSEDNHEALLNQRIGRFKCDQKILNAYLFRVLQTERFRRLVESSCEGSKIKHLYWRHISDFPLVLPTILNQLQICDVFAHFERALRLTNSDLKKALKMRRILNDTVIGSGYVFQRS